MKYSAQLKEYGVKINNLNLRERILVFMLALAFVYFVWYVFIDSLFSSDNETLRAIKQHKDNSIRLRDQINVITPLVAIDQNMMLQKRLNQMKGEGEDLKNKITEQTKMMITPNEMARIIKAVLEKAQGIVVSNIESLGTRSLIDSKRNNITSTKGESAPHPNNTGFQVYDHLLKVEMSGSFFDILNFLESVEKLNLNMFWGELDYIVDTYPIAKVKIIVHTLSLDQGWIGV